MRIALSFLGVHRRGGVERVAFEAARFLADRGHDVHIFADELEASLESRVTYHRVGGLSRPWFLVAPSFFRRCSRQLDPAEFDAVGAFGAPSPLGGVYWTQSVHPAWLEHARAFRPAMSVARWKQRLNPMHPLTLRLERRHFKPVAHSKIIALTKDVQADLHRFYGVPDSMVTVLPNGFHPDEFNLERAASLRAQSRAKLGIAATDRVVLFAANELERKGFGPLIRAVGLLDDSRVHVIVAGRAKPTSYRAEIARLGLNVHYVGPSADMTEWYAAADTFALPTQYEAWGIVIIEALACGVPVLTTARAGAAVAVEHRRTGFLVQRPDDVDDIRTGLEVLLSGTSATPEHMAKAAEPYTWDAVLTQYEQILEDQVERAA